MDNVITNQVNCASGLNFINLSNGLTKTYGDVMDRKLDLER